MIVATAGHIDHGKTLLVKTLTGVDTDRLPEEKARGISIDIGFAYLPVREGLTIGFVDVPGHERFVRNMLAGVCGIDFLMLIVAADDGVMPQTVEHLAIVDLLGISRGIAVITKCDRVAPERIEETKQAVAALLAGTSLEGADIYPVSSVTREGIDVLRARLVQEAESTAARETTGRNFRFAIDRCFSVAGSGTVVTGTVFNGVVATGDHSVISPAGIPVRVRGLQISGHAANRAVAGQRCAINLTGNDLDKAEIGRGDWALAQAVHQPATRIDARVRVLRNETGPLRHWTPVHVHIGTADITARLAIRRGETIAPGASGVVQLILDRPAAALAGDRFILRDQSAMRTIGGGAVIDPFAPGTRRNAPARLAELAAYEQPTPAAALAALLAASPVLDVARFETAFNLTREAAQALYAAAKLGVLGKDARIGVTDAHRAEIRKAVPEAIRRFHAASPQALGKEIEALRAEVAAALPAPVFQQIVRELADEKQVELAGTMVRRPGHSATSNPADEKLWARIEPLLAKDVPLPPSIKELAEQLRLPEKQVSDLLHRRAKGGEPVKVMDDRFMLTSTVARLAKLVEATAKASANGQFTAAEYRDQCGANRKLSILVLEFFDRIGCTQRIGDARKLRKPYQPR